jgi:hypothetical protein
LFGVKRIRTAPYNPRANAPVERLHGFLRGAITALAKDNISEWHRFLPAVAFAYRSTVVKGMGYSPFFLMHGREPVLPGQLVAETKMRVPERTVDFVEELGKRLKYAFQRVIRNDTMTKEERMNKSACLPDERYEVGDRLLHYRKPTDEEESMKITERWHHVMVDLAKHPYYEVRDAEGRVLSCNARFLMRDHTVAGGELRKETQRAVCEARRNEGGGLGIDCGDDGVPRIRGSF